MVFKIFGDPLQPLFLLSDPSQIGPHYVIYIFIKLSQPLFKIFLSLFEQEDQFLSFVGSIFAFFVQTFIVEVYVDPVELPLLFGEIFESFSDILVVVGVSRACLGGRQNPRFSRRFWGLC